MSVLYSLEFDVMEEILRSVCYNAFEKYIYICNVLYNICYIIMCCISHLNHVKCVYDIVPKMLFRCL